jgi:hypothetical protein
VTAGANVDDGKSAMAEGNPVLDVARTAAPISLSTNYTILSQQILMCVPFRIYEGNTFIVRTPVTHRSKASKKLDVIILMAFKKVVSSYSAHYPIQLISEISPPMGFLI